MGCIPAFYILIGEGYSGTAAKEFLKMKKSILFFCFLIIVSGMSFAADFTQGPDCLQSGDILLSGGIAVGSGSFSGSGWGGSSALYGIIVAVDYALEMYGLTVGGEIGYLTSGSGFISFTGIPVMGRLGYHPDFGVPNLDAYALAKLGFARASTGSISSIGFGIGFGVGGRYYFNDKLAGFAELCFENYSFSASAGKATAKRFLTFGITYKMTGGKREIIDEASEDTVEGDI